MEQWTIEATMQDGALIEETTTDYRRFTALWVGFTNDPDCAAVTWRCRALAQSSMAA